MNWLDDYEALRTTGKLPDGSNLMALLERRLAWEIWSEYTFDCRIGRTLEKTGSSTLEVKPDLDGRVIETLLPRLREQIGPLRKLDDRDAQPIPCRTRAESEEPRCRGRARSCALHRESGKHLVARQTERPGTLATELSRASRSPVFLTSRGGERFQTLVRQPTIRRPPGMRTGWRSPSTRWTQPSPTRHRRSTRRSWTDLRKQISSLNEMRGARWYGVWCQRAFQVTTDVVQFRCKHCSFAVSVGADR